MNAVKTILGVDIDEDAPLMEYGVDSLSALEVKSTLEDSLQVQLPVTLLFDYPSARAISEYTQSILHKADASHDDPSLSFMAPATISPTAMVVLRASSVHRSEMGLLHPTRATSFQAQNDAIDVIYATPCDRWNMDQMSHQEKWMPRFGKWLADITSFDASCFGISQMEALLMDPQQRLVLEGASEAHTAFILHKSGIVKRCGQDPKPCQGVYVGLYHPDYNDLSLMHASFNGSTGAGLTYMATGGSSSVAAGRISYTYGMKGPALSIDTACSSSLVATHLGRKDLVGSECTSGLACGINLILTPCKTMATAFAHMLSIDGRCKTLDRAADGYVRGEACVAFVMDSVVTTNRDAETPCSAYDQVVVFDTSAVNQDGRSSALTAPNGPSQQSVIQAALYHSGSVQPISGIHLHGTGTSLGDPIEVGAVHSVFHLHAPMTVLHMQALKSVLGHTEPAAGALGLSAAVVNIVHCSALPLLHLRCINPHVLSVQQLQRASYTEASLSLCVPRQPGSLANPTASNLVRRFGVSAFAYQGTNAHALVSLDASSAGLAVLIDGRKAWERSKSWVAPLMDSVLLDRAMSSSENCHIVVQAKMAGPRLSILWDHMVLHRAIFPGAGYLEMSVEVAKAWGLHLSEAAVIAVSIPRPCVLTLPSTGNNGREIFVSVDVAYGEFDIRSNAQPTSIIPSQTTSQQYESHCSGSFLRIAPCFGDGFTDARDDPKMLCQMGFSVGFTALSRGFTRLLDSAAVGTITSESGENQISHHQTSFAHVDCSIQLGTALVHGDNIQNELRIPTAVAGYFVQETIHQLTSFGVALIAEQASTAKHITSDHIIMTQGRRQNVVLSGLETSPLQANSVVKVKSSNVTMERAVQMPLYELVWQIVPQQTAPYDTHQSRAIQPSASTFTFATNSLPPLDGMRHTPAHPAVTSAAGMLHLLHILPNVVSSEARQLATCAAHPLHFGPTSTSMTSAAAARAGVQAGLRSLVHTHERECASLDGAIHLLNSASETRPTSGDHLHSLMRPDDRCWDRAAAGLSVSRPRLLTSTSFPSTQQQHVATSDATGRAADGVTLRVQAVSMSVRSVLREVGVQTSAGWNGAATSVYGDASGLVVNTASPTAPLTTAAPVAYAKVCQGDAVLALAPAVGHAVYTSTAHHLLCPKPGAVLHEEAASLPTTSINMQ
eukprot:gene9852-11667_t